MSEKILKLRISSHCVDLVVADVDRCLLMDVLNEMEEKAACKGIEITKIPILAYAFNLESVDIMNDMDLLKMFDVFPERTEFELWIGHGKTPYKDLTMARQLKASQKNSCATEAMPSLFDNLSRTYSPNTLPQVSESISPVILSSTPLRNGKKLSVRKRNQNQKQIDDERPPTNSPPPILTRSPTSMPEVLASESQDILATRDSQQQPALCSQKSQLTQPPPTHDSQYIPPPPSELAPMKKKIILTRKMAQTTARRKGLWVCKGSTPQTMPEFEASNEPSRRCGRGVTTLTSNGEDVQVSGDCSDDDDYNFLHSERNDTSSRDFIIEDVEDGALDGIFDHYDPYRERLWVDGEDDYFDFLYKNGEMYEDKGWGQIYLKPWQLFSDKDHFKDVLKDFCIQEGHAYVVRKGDKQRYTVECLIEGCDWRVHASVLPDNHTWAIKSMRSEHTCNGIGKFNPLADVEWVGKKIMDDIRAQPDMSEKVINNLLMRKFGLNMRQSTVYKMRNWVLTQVQGGHDTSYALLPAYCEMVKSSNPNSIAICTWRTMETPERPLQFTSIFVSFTAQIDGVIRGCRGLIGVDGTHLKGNYGGVLLAAVALDGNNELFLVACCIVDAENKNSWSYFFHHLKNSLQQSGRDDWTVICDRQKGVDPALDDVWPNADRRYCCVHLGKNFKKTYPGLLMYKLFWKACNAYSDFTFKIAMENIKKHGGLGALQWFKDLGALSKWSKHKFNHALCCEENTSNFVESFNSTLGADRCNPVLTLLEGIRRTTMVRLSTRATAAEKWNDEGICPNILTYLRKLIKDSRSCVPYLSDKGLYEIQDGYNSGCNQTIQSFIPVSLRSRTCGCGQWQVSGIPCRHAIRAIIQEQEDPTSYVSEWYSVKRYKMAYGGRINPIADHAQWPSFSTPTLEPPALKRSIGRPPRNRRREEDEKQKGKRSATVKCTKCKAYGHNKRTCKGGPTAKEMREGITVERRQRQSKKRNLEI